MRAIQLPFEAAVEAAAGTAQPVGREHAGELALVAEEILLSEDGPAPEADEGSFGMTE